MIGICLGFQQILFCEGAKIVQQKQIYHGFQSEIKVISKNSIFKYKNKLMVGRYHSLKLKEPFYSENFDITMRCVISGSAMAVENNIDKIYGFQFHPESFLTINGNLLIKKILSA
jgi:anthranilate/para-aminobenzoate synthase component II